jgi:hypothetical protein
LGCFRGEFIFHPCHKGRVQGLYPKKLLKRLSSILKTFAFYFSAFHFSLYFLRGASERFNLLFDYFAAGPDIFTAYVLAGLRLFEY